MPDRKSSLRLLAVLIISITFAVAVINYKQTLSAAGSILGVLSPFIIGLCTAFILNIPVRLLENGLFGSKKIKKNRFLTAVKRPVCIILSILLVLGIIALLGLLIVPEIKNTVVQFASELPSRINSLGNLIDDLQKKTGITAADIDKLEIDWNAVSKKIIERFAGDGSSFITGTISFTSGIVSAVFNLVMGFVFAVYILSGKEKLGNQSRRLLYAVLKKSTADNITGLCTLSNNIFSRFIVGQCTEALILGTLCYIGMLIFSMPYAVMISSLVAVTALIPIIGAFIGTAFGAVMILLVNPMQAVWFVVYIIILQQFESNIIYPRVVGKSVGLPGMWVLLAVTVGGGLFGMAGMLVSVPVCSVFYCLMREFLKKHSETGTQQ